MSGLVDFLLARIAEREAAARACDDRRWTLRSHPSDSSIVKGETYTVVYDEGSPSEEQAEHIALNDPAYVLADCEAKRRIVERHRPEEFADAPGEFFCSRCQRTAEVWPCPDVMDLALPYADHPDYRQEWRP